MLKVWVALGDPYTQTSTEMKTSKATFAAMTVGTVLAGYGSARNGRASVRRDPCRSGVHGEGLQQR